MHSSDKRRSIRAKQKNDLFESEFFLSSLAFVSRLELLPALSTVVKSLTVVALVVENRTRDPAELGLNPTMSQAFSFFQFLNKFCISDIKITKD